MVLESSSIQRSQMIVMDKFCSLALLLLADLNLLQKPEDADWLKQGFTNFKLSATSAAHAEGRMAALSSAVQAVHILKSVCLGSAKPQQASKGLMDALKIVLQVGWPKQQGWLTDAGDQFHHSLVARSLTTSSRL